MAEPIEQPVPPYVRIVTELRRRIAVGELRAGDKVPSTRQIVQEWGVAMATATKVLTTLRQEGLVRAVAGVGTVVEAPQPRTTPPPPPPPRRREPREPEQELTQERIVRTSMEIADQEGLASLSMRRVATELGVATMSLYRYVQGKDALVLLMTEAAFAEEKLPDPPPPGWRTRLELYARLQRTLFRRHPWLAGALSISRPQASPKGMAHTEWALSAVDGLGLDPTTMLYVSITLFGYVRGIAIEFEREAQAQQDTGLTDEQWMEAQDTKMASVITSGPFPVLSGIIAQGGIDFDLDTLFEFGLQRMLDGLAVFLGTPGK
jgi:DNA-binding transcriptional regulator YhcF (GntR family)